MEIKSLQKRFFDSLELSLFSANIPFSAKEWIGIWLALGAFLLLIGSIFKIFYGLGLFFMCIILLFALPELQVGRMRAGIEKPLPDALHHMSVAIRTGLVIESVIQEISEADYGPLSDEFTKITIEMKRGRPLRKALLAFSERSKSPQVKRAVTLIVEGIESGGAISDVLEEVSEDLRAIRTIQRERKSLTSQQISFLAMAALMAGPFVMGVVAALPTIMTGMAGEGGMFSPALMNEIQGVIAALSFYVFAQATSAGVMMGVVMYGDIKKGFKFSLPLGIVAFVIYTLVRTIMPGAVAIF